MLRNVRHFVVLLCHCHNESRHVLKREQRDIIYTYIYVCHLLFVADIDYCINATCKNGASCVDGLKDYTCSCVTGFTGDHCETGVYQISFFKCKKQTTQRKHPIILANWNIDSRNLLLYYLL